MMTLLADAKHGIRQIPDNERQPQMSFQIHPATRSAVKPLIGLYGKSGGGKTLSGLLTLRGLVGPKGRIVAIDTENRRAAIFADIVPGGYSVLDLEPPFSPERYWEAIQAAEAESNGILIDSFSHEWAGEGGVLDMQEAELTRMAGDNWQKRESCKMASWIRPKMAHKRLVERLLRLKQPLIVCLRGEEKTHIDKENGKTVVHTDKFSSPIADPRFIFEMLIHAETFAQPNEAGHMIGGFLRITKITHHDVIGLLPKAGEQIGIKHGEALAKWCGGVAGTIPEKNTESSDLKSIKSKLWNLTAIKHNGNPKALEQWLWDEGLMSDTEALAELTAQRMAEILIQAPSKLKVAA